MNRRALVSLCLCAAACGASTNLVRTWRDPGYTRREVKRVLVIALTPNLQNQRTFEDAMAARLASVQVEPFKAIDVLPQGRMADQDTITEAVRKNAIDLVLVTKLVALRTEAEYVPGSVAYAPSPGYYGMYPYYAAGYTAVYSPGYVTSTQAVYLETNAYDTAAGKLVWSGLTRTFDFSSADAVSTSAAKQIAVGLIDQGIL